MEITYNGVEKSASLESLIEERTKRLEKVCDNLISCHLTISKPHAHQESGSGFSVMIEARVPPNHQLVATEKSSHGDIHDSVETVVRRSFDSVERQLKDLMNKLREDKRQSPEEDGTGTVIVVDKTKRYGIIKTQAGRDVYFVESAVLNDDFDRIEIGTAVRYVDEPGDEGPRASTVQIVEKKGGPMAASGPTA